MARTPNRRQDTAVDPVLLAAAVGTGNGQPILDVGCGAGAVSLCLAARDPGARVTGVEIDDALLATAVRNAAENRFGNLSFGRADVAKPFTETGLSVFAQVVTNPPFGDPARGNASPDPVRRRARVGDHVTLQQWLTFCIDALRPKGRLTLIFGADRLDELMAALSGKTGEVTIFPIWTKPGRRAKRVIVSARKGVSSPVCLAPGLVLQDETGEYTLAARSILVDASPLDILSARQ